LAFDKTGCGKAKTLRAKIDASGAETSLLTDSNFSALTQNKQKKYEVYTQSRSATRHFSAKDTS